MIPYFNYDYPVAPPRDPAGLRQAMADTSYLQHVPFACPVPVVRNAATGVSNMATYFQNLNMRVTAPLTSTSKLQLKLEELRRKLGELRLLQPGWDGRGADAPSGIAVDTADSVLQLAEKLGRPPDRMAADVEGGVAVYFFGSERGTDGGSLCHAGVLIDNSGEVYVYAEERGMKRSIPGHIVGTHDEFLSSIKKIVSFLQA